MINNNNGFYIYRFFKESRVGKVSRAWLKEQQQSCSSIIKSIAQGHHNQLLSDVCWWILVCYCSLVTPQLAAFPVQIPTLSPPKPAAQWTATRPGRGPTCSLCFTQRSNTDSRFSLTHHVHHSECVSAVDVKAGRWPNRRADCGAVDWINTRI